MLCTNCAEILPDDARFCLKCGQTLDPATANTISGSGVVSKTGKANLPRAGRQSLSAIWVLVLVVLLAIGWMAAGSSNTAQQLRELLTGAHTEAITEKSFSVNAHGFSSYKFLVPPGAVNISVGGQFSATGAQANDVQVYVLSDDAFVTWRNGYAISPYYDSGKVPQGNIHATLPAGAGTYYLIFNNNFSVKAAKAVQADVTLHYNTLWPEWMFHLKDKLWGE